MTGLIRRLVRGRLLAVTVTGSSMEPSLRDGDRLLVLRRHPRRLTRGQVVVLRPPRHRPGAVRPHRDGDVLVLRQGWSAPQGSPSLVIKRIAAAPGDPVSADLASALDSRPGGTVPRDHFVVLGDNPARSIDSRHFGYVSEDRVLGVAVRPLRRSGA
ncbi:S26 family signal peptidase [Streptomyces acidicola]|uniref:S26 family signal peptidase n=1 Tax=Streptomyces acidicola TaxID=2596892 RepID=UPI0034355C95